MEVLNGPVPEVVAEVDETNAMIDSIVIVQITIRKEIKSGRAPGIDSIMVGTQEGTSPCD